MKRFAVTVVSPPGYVHSAAFHEVAESLHYALLELGHDCVLTTQGNLEGRQHIVLGANLLPSHPMALSEGAILYNLEQVDDGSRWFPPRLIAVFQRHTVWDYSPRNAAALRARGVNVAHVVPIGYTHELTRIAPAGERDIDVLFYGGLNPRRQLIIDAMRASGLEVVTATGVYGEQRDSLIARAKVVLNVHFYEAKVLEMVRITYLLANRCTVLSETSADPEEDSSLAGSVAFADYGNLVEEAGRLVRDEALRHQLAEQGYRSIVARPMAGYVQQALLSTP
jgi:hypothetical protein